MLLYLKNVFKFAQFSHRFSAEALSENRELFRECYQIERGRKYPNNGFFPKVIIAVTK